MNRGVLVFARNNGATNYVQLAQWQAQHIRRHLGLPVAVITDHADVPGFDHTIVTQRSGGNHRYFSDYDQSVSWHNLDRADAYDITPWEETLVLDADYVVASDRLSSLFDCNQDFLAHRWAHDITGENDFQGLNWFGTHRMPMWWATVMLFRKTKQSRLIFECMQMVRDNWNHYRLLHGVRQPAYRNDYALSISLGIVNGHVSDHASIPWSMPSVMLESRIECKGPDSYRIDYTNSCNQLRWLPVAGQDFHAMGKKHLEAMIANLG